MIKRVHYHIGPFHPLMSCILYVTIISFTTSEYVVDELAIRLNKAQPYFLATNCKICVILLSPIRERHSRHHKSKEVWTTMITKQHDNTAEFYLFFKRGKGVLLPSRTQPDRCALNNATTWARAIVHRRVFLFLGALLAHTRSRMWTADMQQQAIMLPGLWGDPKQFRTIMITPHYINVRVKQYVNKFCMELVCTS